MLMVTIVTAGFTIYPLTVVRENYIKCCNDKILH